MMSDEKEQIIGAPAREMSSGVHCPPPPPPGGKPDGTVEGTRGDDLIDASYRGDAEGDMVDRGDAILPGAAPDDDLIYGYQGNDTVMAGEGDDVVYGGAGDDRIFGGAGNDILSGDMGRDIIFGGDGDDVIYGGTGDDTLKGNDGNDLIFGDKGNDYIGGGNGDDTLKGNEGDDTIFGDDGDDLIGGNAGDDTVYGGRGNDTILDDIGRDTYYGGADRDLFVGGNDGDAIYGGSEGDDFDILDLRGTGRFRLVNVVTDSDGNGIDGTVEFLDRDGNVTGRMTFENIEQIIPCFTPGTAIATPRGERLVEELREGDRIITRDNGIQEIRWVGVKTMSGRALLGAPHLRPILIKAGSLGNGLPERDLLVSPNHRLLVSNERTQLYFEESEVLAAAKHLVGSPGIHAVDTLSVTYIHFMFDRHEVVLSNGAWTESFQPGDYSLKGIGNAQRNELFELFPELKTREGIENYQAARKSLKKHEARLLVR